jgi:hypothetical protein
MEAAKGIRFVAVIAARSDAIATRLSRAVQSLAGVTKFGAM